MSVSQSHHGTVVPPESGQVRSLVQSHLCEVGHLYLAYRILHRNPQNASEWIVSFYGNTVDGSRDYAARRAERLLLEDFVIPEAEVAPLLGQRPLPASRR